MKGKLNNFIFFVRPHTVIGTSLSILTLYILALSLSSHQDLHPDVLIFTLISCLGANIYIVGLNQITDVAIDRINKPYLPLASGAYSMRTGYILIGIAVLVSLAIAIYFGGFLFLTVLLSLVLGTIYSLPPIRLKRFHFWAAFCIIAVRGLIVNLLLFLHFHLSINGKVNLPPVIWLLTVIIFVYSLIIAWYKDMPDMKGDLHYQIKTLSLRIGARKVFLAGNILISLTFFSLIVLPIFHDFPINEYLLVISHFLLLVVLWILNARVDFNVQESLFRYYHYIWRFFFAEYIIFAMAGILSF